MDSFVEQALNEIYEKAEREDAIPWHDAPCECTEIFMCLFHLQARGLLEETFPEEPG